MLEVTSADRLEPWELIRYNVGQYFSRHVDGKDRTHSVVVYLNDVPAGGETAFPVLGRVVKPELGKAVIWDNQLGSRQSKELVHESRPVLDGQKWVLVSWVRA